MRFHKPAGLPEHLNLVRMTTPDPEKQKYLLTLLGYQADFTLNECHFEQKRAEKTTKEYYESWGMR